MQTFTEFAQTCRARVDRALDLHFPQNSDPTKLRTAMRYSLFNGGKRVRPTLAYAAALAVNPEINLEALDPSPFALECLHF